VALRKKLCTSLEEPQADIGLAYVQQYRENPSGQDVLRAHPDGASGGWQATWGGQGDSLNLI